MAQRRNFHRHVLNPLFFDTLNTPPERRRRAMGLGDVPYLNGGLFELHPAERRIGPTFFANHLWREVFDNLPIQKMQVVSPTSLDKKTVKSRKVLLNSDQFSPGIYGTAVKSTDSTSCCMQISRPETKLICLHQTLECLSKGYLPVADQAIHLEHNLCFFFLGC